ncbi:nucleotide exchange factor GrpE [Actinocorallia lasiicapitis]
MTNSSEEPVIRDSRRIDPETGEVRVPAADEAAEPGVPEQGEASSEESAALQAALDERTADLQRLQAEYQNYRKRALREQGAAKDYAVGSVVGDLLPVLDSIDKAREHDELVGPFKSVGEGLESALGKLGLEKFGTVGEPFDPNVHEALTHVPSPDVAEETVLEIYQAGYRIGERVLRPARVVVAGPAQ